MLKAYPSVACNSTRTLGSSWGAKGLYIHSQRCSTKRQRLLPGALTYDIHNPRGPSPTLPSRAISPSQRSPISRRSSTAAAESRTGTTRRTVPSNQARKAGQGRHLMSRSSQENEYRRIQTLSPRNRKRLRRPAPQLRARWLRPRRSVRPVPDRGVTRPRKPLGPKGGFNRQVHHPPLTCGIHDRT